MGNETGRGHLTTALPLPGSPEALRQGCRCVFWATQAPGRIARSVVCAMHASQRTTARKPGG